ncbi:hypothetical protein GCM10008967_35090 [Bacillus carboniphilus]|uniref:Ligand-binding SRPBCC domain-containing protein n=1 Tax=Bacillus carboniphilus TaxID=86663 RepID=A0ABN0WN50_9BACI
MFKGTYKHFTTFQHNMETVWGFYSNPKNLSKITRFPEVTFERNPVFKKGGKMPLMLHFFIFRVKWVLVFKDIKENAYFIDEALVVPFPFKKWKHTHTFIQKSEHIVMEDKIEYESYLPNWATQMILKKMFRGRDSLSNWDRGTGSVSHIKKRKNPNGE